jgi:hypothetical protein
MTPGHQVGPVRADHHVLRLDLSARLDPTDVDVTDSQHVVVAYGSPHSLGDLGVRLWHRLHQQPHPLGGQPRLVDRTVGHGRNDLLQRTTGVPGEQHVLGATQRDGDGDGLARGEVQRRQTHRAVECVAARAPAPGRERDAGLSERTEITLDGADAHLEVGRELPGRAPARSGGAQFLDQCVEAVDAVHGRNLAPRSDTVGRHDSRICLSRARSFWLARRIAAAITGVATFAKPAGSPQFRKVIRVAEAPSACQV